MEKLFLILFDCNELQSINGFRMPAYYGGFYSHLLPGDRLKCKAVVMTHAKGHLASHATSAFAHVYKKTISLVFFTTKTYKRETRSVYGSISRSPSAVFRYIHIELKVSVC
jgi:hypothetical protein